jgi:HlyD family secretion protein
MAYLLAAAGIVAVFQVSRASNRPVPENVPVVSPVEIGFSNRIAGRGLVESSAEDVRISPALPGLVREVTVRVGSEVRLGDILLQQDDRAVQSQLKRQWANLELLTRRVAEARVDVADKADSLSRQTRLAKEAIATVEELTRARFAHERAVAVLATAEAQVEAAQADVNDSKTQIELLTLRAPRAGTVLQINTRVGEFIGTGTSSPAMVLGSTERLQVRVDIDEENASRVVPGSPAVGLPKGSATNLLSLTFVRLEPYLVPKKSLSGESSERVDTRVLQVIYSFDRGSARIYPGQQMDVWIANSTAE